MGSYSLTCSTVHKDVSILSNLNLNICDSYYKKSYHCQTIMQYSDEESSAEVNVIMYGLPTEVDIRREDQSIFATSFSMLPNFEEKHDQKETLDCDSSEIVIDHGVFSRIWTGSEDNQIFNFQAPLSLDRKEISVQMLQENPVKCSPPKVKKPLNHKISHKKKKHVSKTSCFKAAQLSETKNIPKNYGKQIIKFVQKNKVIIEHILASTESVWSYSQLVSELKKQKRSLNKISDLRKLWVEAAYAREFRIISLYFLRKHCFVWIFNSKIENIKFPIKYRARIIEGVHKPAQFQHLKEY